MEATRRPAAAALKDMGESVVHTFSDDVERNLVTYVFDHEDNPHIPVGEKRQLMACSFRSYCLIRRKLTQVFTAFVTVANKRGRLPAELYANRNNKALLRILNGVDRADNDLLIVPMQRCGGTFTAMGGVRFVDTRHHRMCQSTGTINLVMGTHSIDLSARAIDKYVDLPGVDFEPGLWGML